MAMEPDELVAVPALSWNTAPSLVKLTSSFRRMCPRTMVEFSDVKLCEVMEDRPPTGCQ